MSCLDVKTSLEILNSKCFKCMGFSRAILSKTQHYFYYYCCYYFYYPSYYCCYYCSFTSDNSTAATTTTTVNTSAATTATPTAPSTADTTTKETKRTSRPCFKIPNKGLTLEHEILRNSSLFQASKWKLYIKSVFFYLKMCIVVCKSA